METAIYFDKIPQDLKSIFLKDNLKDLKLLFWSELNANQKKEALKLANYYLVTAYSIDKELIDSAPNLKFIQKIGIGLNNIDLNAAKNRGVYVSNTPGGNAVSVSELTILLILAVYRKLIEIDKNTKDGHWLSWIYRSTSFEMKDKVHGLIGMGNIGYETAKRSSAFGTKILYYDKHRLTKQRETEINAQYVEMEELIKQSDIISLHVPLLEETRYLITKRELEKMKKNAILINVARGEIVNETDLYEALQREEIAGAAIDAWQTEPDIKGNPLLSLSNVVATPHIGGGTVETFKRVIKIGFQNVASVRVGEKPSFLVNA